ncbi:hypothetical protein SYK_06820 [Pseudodesulfovibrio nedwellii]|uniref:Uncharacterized protein n=1 Tax=Pseudodesulfovibrio nedwellii TaxID=2973072 RepID=A0ABM8AXS8_9BACT|nr:hypothetical protein SYK_02710 [Pseudodesulfovibrio nedwellii]BDQ36322.1 hypothetical protein SYK_06820 [Pseudodesulfovibrio nedwellii]
MREKTLATIQAHLDAAREKHPVFTPDGDGLLGALAKISEELGEVYMAKNDDEGLDRIVSEIFDLIAPAIRTAQGEYHDNSAS